MKNFLTTVLLSFFLLAPFTSLAADDQSGLLDVVTKALDVSEKQGMGGLGSLFDYVKGNVSTDDFSSLAASIPGMDKYLSAIPDVASDSDKSSSGLGGLLEKAGEFSDTAKSASELQKQFEALGLSSEKIGQYANVAMDYFGDSNNSGAMDILKKGLSGFL